MLRDLQVKECGTLCKAINYNVHMMWKSVRQRTERYIIEVATNMLAFVFLAVAAKKLNW